jgi:aminoglycoside 3-N-acetyltransferase I
MDYSIQKLSTADIALARQLIQLWNEQDHIADPPEPSDRYLTGLLSSEAFHVYAAVQEDRLIGGLTAYELPMFKEEIREMFLYEIGVHEKYQQKGIAKNLIQELKKACGQKGIKIIFVGSSMDNLAAQQLYAGTGGAREDIPWYTYELGNIDAGQIVG